MDYYLTGQSHLLGPDSLSLQEMLDMDIKSENDYESVFSCADLNFNFTELPALNLDEDSLGAPGDNNVWLTSSNDSHSLLGGDLSSSMNLDLNSGETRMVCPNSVMPVTLIQVPYDYPTKGEDVKNVKPSLSEMKAIEMSTPKGIKQEVKSQQEDDEVFNEKEYLKDGITFNHEVDIKTEYDESDEETFQEAYARAVAFKNSQSAKGKVKTPISRTPTRLPVHSNKRSVQAVRSANSKKRLQEYNVCTPGMLGTSYPKPGYSYSCLIAMALKNSPSGSLPVSEIYNFMCEHFPYFKTAPSGWKNSVRHNLSLNKCFEKIEKPATNGSQRKGCLWAMNPNKVGKMDEEVQKWSKKDKLAIKKSMICPESLDALERGELSGNYNHNPGSIETIHSEIESEEETWDHARQNSWSFKHVSEDEEEEEDDEEAANRETNKSVPFPDTEEFDESDISLTDFDIDVAESIYKDMEAPEKLLRLNLKSPTTSLQPLAGIGLSGGNSYMIQNSTLDSPKRAKTFEGSTISGNYVYKPLGTSSSRRKSPLRPTLITSFEADD